MLSAIFTQRPAEPSVCRAINHAERKKNNNNQSRMKRSARTKKIVVQTALPSGQKKEGAGQHASTSRWPYVRDTAGSLSLKRDFCIFHSFFLEQENINYSVNSST